MHTFKMSERQAERLHAMVRDQTEAVKNWIASAVDHDEIERAKELTQELKELRKLFSAFNIPAKADIARRQGKEASTEHVVEG